MILKGSATNITGTASNFGRATRIRVGATNAGTVTVAAAVGTFNAESAVDGAVITISSHGFITGDQVTYSDGGGTTITELVNGRNYYVISLNANTLSLTNTFNDAERGTGIALTDGSSENHTITATNTNAGTVTLVQNDVIIIDKKASDTIAANGTMTGTSIGNQP